MVCSRLYVMVQVCWYKRKGFISQHIETVPSLRSDTSCCPQEKHHATFAKLVVCKFSMFGLVQSLYRIKECNTQI